MESEPKRWACECYFAKCTGSHHIGSDYLIRLSCLLKALREAVLVSHTSIECMTDVIEIEMESMPTTVKLYHVVTFFFSLLFDDRLLFEFVYAGHSPLFSQLRFFCYHRLPAHAGGASSFQKADSMCMHAAKATNIKELFCGFRHHK